jgi:alcohol dehydrogenase (NADP+)
MLTKAYAAASAGAPLEPMEIERRELGAHDVLIDIKFSGICHSDIHQAREEWGQASFPMVPGHEITGVVAAVGSKVTKFAVGDHAGVGVFVDSCRECDHCTQGLEQYCTGHMSVTYNGTEADKVTPTQGGYSQAIVVDENYALHIPENLPLDIAAPLLCAGITVYSPLREWKVGPGTSVGVVGLGGLGHMAVKIAHAMGADVTLISHSAHKEEDARKLGAQHFLLSTDKGQMKAAANSLDVIINTVSASIDLDRYLSLLTLDGTLVMVGLPVEPLSLRTFTLTGSRRRLAGSQIGSIAETQEMLNFCAEKGFGADIEMIDAQYINTAWDRVVNSDVKYRFVIDASTL